MYKSYVLCSFLLKIVYSLEHLEGWNYINLHCRDNDNRPVDWWYMYKPPAEIIPFRELGRNFLFITSDNAGRWRESDRQITSNSMLQHTVAPMFRPTYSDYLAMVIYEQRKGGATPGNSSPGILMADELGGVWIGHTVPGLIDLRKDRPSFPQTEMANGHLLVCVSLDLATLNRMALLVKDLAPRFTRIQIPTLMRGYLPDWNFLEYTNKRPMGGSKNQLEYLSKNKTLRGKMILRKPGDKACPYARFAQKMSLVLDVYAHNDHKLPYCFSNYSVRNIDRISMKSVEYVHYISRGRDRSSFAVSTAAYWQKLGRAGLDQYWTCTGPPDDSSASGGILMCVDNYEVWQTFDNFKVKEPQC